MRVECACGWEVAGDEDEVIAETTRHGVDVHNMAVTREQVLAMAVEDQPPADRPS